MQDLRDPDVNEAGGLRLEVGDLTSEVGDPKSEVGDPKLEVGERRSPGIPPNLTPVDDTASTALSHSVAR